MREPLHIDSISWIVKRIMLRHFVGQGIECQDAEGRANRFSDHSGRVGLFVASAEADVPPQHMAAVARHRGLAMARRYSKQADMLVCAPYSRKGVGV